MAKWFWRLYKLSLFFLFFSFSAILLPPSKRSNDWVGGEEEGEGGGKVRCECMKCKDLKIPWYKIAKTVIDNYKYKEYNLL